MNNDDLIAFLMRWVLISCALNVMLLYFWLSERGETKMADEDRNWWQRQCKRTQAEADKYFRWWLDSFK